MGVHAPTQARPIRQALTGSERIVRSTAFEALARSGFVARGLVYGLIGVLAIKLALGSASKAADQQGALKTIAQQPFGKVLLIGVAIGLAGYALWRFLHALLGHGPEHSDSRFDRVAAFGSGVVYAIICAVAVEILLGAGEKSPHKAAAGVFGWPAGTWLVGVIGGALVGVALYQGYRGISGDFLDDSKTEEMRPKIRRWIEWIGTFGHLARMVIFGLVGVFLIRSAVEFNPAKAVGLDGALAKVAHASYGPYMLGIVATGLIAFGVYSLSDARYRRI
jgi:fumarate reductase subunit D